MKYAVVGQHPIIETLRTQGHDVNLIEEEHLNNPWVFSTFRDTGLRLIVTDKYDHIYCAIPKDKFLELMELGTILDEKITFLGN